METKEIAQRLYELCQKGDFGQALDELFSPEAVSIEPYAGMGFEKETRGIAAIKAKGEQWNNMVETFHGSEISEPILAPHSFALTMSLDVTMKERGRSTMSEICLYKVKDGKIISEEFIM